MFIAGALSGAWWYEQEIRNGEELSHRRDKRLSSRLRGALADLREKVGSDEVTLLLPHHIARRTDIIKSLNDCTTTESLSDVPEEPERPSTPSDVEQIPED